LLTLLSAAGVADAMQMPLQSESHSSAALYVLGPDDQITVWAREVDELNNAAFVIDSSGFVNLPMIGRVHAAGSTTEQLEQVLVERLKAYLLRPQVVVNITRFRTISVSVMGAVVTPGVREIREKQRLAEVILSAGGLKPDASPVIRLTRKIERGRIPLDYAKDDPSGQYSSAEINLTKAMQSNPVQNVEILADDVLTVNVLPVVFVTGDVAKPGPVSADSTGGVSVLKAISAAGGLGSTASPQKARIIRVILDGKKQAELPIDVKKLMQGKAPDVQMLPSDILFIPGSVSKAAAIKALQSGLTIGTAGALWLLRY
jgi:polysaccharide export outer membrane protein